MPMTESQTLQRYLESGERLLWSGRPKQGVLFHASDIFVAPFSLLWCGFAIFWEWNVLQTNAPLFFLAFGGVFVLLGLHLVFGRFILDARQREKTYYGVSDQRVIIVSGLLNIKTKSLSLRTLTDVTLTEKANGEGTITFGSLTPFAGFQNAFAFPGMGGAAQAPQFDAIPQAKNVYNIIRDAQRKA